MPGQYCKRPSEHSGPFVPFHKERDLKALEFGYYDHSGNDNCGPNSDTPRAQRILKQHKQQPPIQTSLFNI